jgi:hypothetical protein
MSRDDEPEPKPKPRSSAGGGGDRAGWLATAGFLILIQLLAGAGTWWLSFSPPLKVVACVAYLLWLYLAARAGWVLGGLPGWARILAVLTWQGPALVFGTWILLDFSGVVRVPDAGMVLVQVWNYPVSWLLAELSPALAPGGHALSLWAQAGAPWLVATAVLVVAARR